MLTTHWQQYLASQRSRGAAGNHTTDLNAPVTQTILVDASYQGILAVTGIDALRFLQGQTTCDFQQINNATSHLGACCTPKGRMFTNFRAVCIHDIFYLQMHSALVESTRIALDKYIRFFKATMSDATNDWIRIGISGPDADTLLKNHIGTIPSTIDDVTPIDTSGITVRLPGSQPRFELWLNNLHAAQTCWETLSTHAQQSEPSHWELLNIQAGIATLTPETVDAFTPHMINYQSVNGINLTKGCYTGQERDRLLF